MGMFGQPSQFPTMYPGAYSPGQMFFNSSPELSQLISAFSGPVLGQMAGPGSFVPHMSPTQMLVDQFAMRNHQNQALQSNTEMAHDGQAHVAKFLLGGRSMFTKSGPSELNKEQAMNMAGIVNNPYVKPFLGAMVGPENLEAIMHGSKGDVHSLSSTLNRVGFFRHDPTGPGRMDSESLTDYNRGVYSHMYEPQGNLENLEQRARSTDAATATAGRTQLKKAAHAPEMDIVEDDEVVTRLQKMKKAPEKIDELYERFVTDGKATTTTQKAQELSKFDNAIQASKVLGDNETTISGLKSRAEQAATGEMRGFMAGQVGQITENMFQRGMIPKEIGTMSAAERARMINQTPVEDETLHRLSKEMTRRDFESKTNTSDDARKFRGLTTEKERQEFVEQKSGANLTALQNTRKEVEKTASGAAGAMDATDLEKLKGFDSLASNVDAKRSADAIKKYTGAVSAIKDIFGDNGNPNAPLPALLAALEGLTGGAIGSMKPAKVEATLRQMQTLAKEAGIGFEQMAAMSSQIDSTGQMLGLTPADTLRLKGGAMAAAKVMQDTGAFSNPVYGQSDKGTATQLAGQMITQGAASRGAKTMAAIASIYEMDDKDPATGKSKRFAGTELEKAMEAYRDNKGDGSYTFNGEKKNIREIVAKYGEAGALGILTGSGGTEGEYAAQRDNPLAMQHSEEMFGFLAQRHEILNRVNYGDTQGRMINKLKNTSIMQGHSKDEQERIGAQLGEVMTGLVLDTSGETPQDQIVKIRENLEQKFTEVFAKEYPGDPARAAAMAKEAATAMSGSATLHEVVGGANTTHKAITGRNMAQEEQLRGNGRDMKAARESENAYGRGARRAETGFGYQNNFMANMSDYLAGISERGEQFDSETFFKHMANVTTDREILGKYAEGMKGGFDTITDLRKEALVTNSYVDELAEKKDVTTLKELAGLSTSEVKVIDNDAANVKRSAHIKKTLEDTSTKEATEKSNKALSDAYKKYIPGSAAVNPKDITPEKRKSMMQELQKSETFMADMEESALGSGTLSIRQLAQQSRKASVGTARRGMEDLAANVDKMEKAMLEGSNADTLKAGTFAALNTFGVSASDKQIDELMSVMGKGDTSEAGTKKLTDTIDSLGIKDPATKEKLTNVFKSYQTGVPLDVGRTLGISQITDREMMRELTADFEQKGFGDAAGEKAKQVVDSIAKQKEAAQKDGKTLTTAEQRKIAQTEIAAGIEKSYEADVKTGKMTPEAAKAQAQKEAEAVMQKTEKGVADSVSGEGVQQRVNTLEVTAQNVIIKGGRFEAEGGGKGSAGGGIMDMLTKMLGGEKPAIPAAAADAAMTAAGGDGASLMDTAASMAGVDLKTAMASSGGLEVLSNLATGNVLSGAVGAAQQLGFLGLSGKAPKENKPGETKPDAPLAPQAAAPTSPAPESEKVAQASGEQLKHDKGVATNEPAAAAGPQPAAAPQEKKTAYDLTETDIRTALGGDSALKSSDKQKTEFLQSKGLLNNIKDIKDAKQRGADNDLSPAEEEFETGMRDAIASGLIPHPVDKDGDPITDFTSDEAIAAAEKHLEKYLPKSKETAADSAAAPPQPEQQTPAQKSAEELAVSENKRNAIYADSNLADRAMADYAHHEKASAEAKQKADDPSLPEAERDAAKKAYRHHEKRKDDKLHHIAEFQTAQAAGMDISGGKSYSSKYRLSAGGPEGLTHSFSFNGQQLNPDERNDRLAVLRQKVDRGESIASEKAEQLVAARDEVAQKKDAATQAGATKEEINSARKSAYTAPPPSSMSGLIDAAKASPAGQAVLHGATAVYEKYAPQAVKDAVAGYTQATQETNDEQYRLQEVYAQSLARTADSPSNAARENNEKYTKTAIRQLGVHAAARAAGADTSEGIVYSQDRTKINGVAVSKEEIERHTRLLEEKAKKDPLALVSPDVQKKLKIGKYADPVAKKNDDELKKVSGTTSANVTPAEAAAATAATAATTTADPTQKSTATAPATADAPLAAAGQAQASSPLSAALPDTEMTKPNAAPVSRVHAMAADTPTVSASAAAPAGASGGQSGGSMTINGTLTLSGLQEAILNAQGGNVMHTDGGAPVVIGNTSQSNSPAPAKP
jgi:hypothetical protein